MTVRFTKEGEQVIVGKLSNHKHQHYKHSTAFNTLLEEEIKVHHKGLKGLVER